MHDEQLYRRVRYAFVFGSIVALTALYSVTYHFTNAMNEGVVIANEATNFAVLFFLGYLGVISFSILQRAVLAIRSKSGEPGIWQLESGENSIFVLF